MEQVSLDALNSADRKTFMAAIGEVMELAPWVAEETFARRPFASIAALYQAMTDAVRNAPTERRQALIDGHPDLAGKAAGEGKLTADLRPNRPRPGSTGSASRSLPISIASTTPTAKNLPCRLFVCVRRHGKQSILREFARRLNNDAAAEQKTALDEIFRIAALRLDQRVTVADRLKVHGHLSTHVLDVHGGHPAQGVAIELCEIAGAGEARHQARRNQRRRAHRRAAVSGMPIPIATYELRFFVADYFANARAPMAEPPFLDIVPVRFSIAEPEGRYHVPL